MGKLSLIWRRVHPCILALILSFGGGVVATDALADQATIDELKRVVGPSGTPQVLRGVLPPELGLHAREFFDFQGNTKLVGAKIELTFSRAPAQGGTFDHYMSVAVILGTPTQSSAAQFLQGIMGGAATQSVSCGDGIAALKSGDDGTTISIIAESKGRAMIVEATEPYNTDFRHGEAILRNLAIGVCQMYAGGDGGATPPIAISPVKPEVPYDPFDYSGIIIEMEEPDKLVDSGVENGKAYRAVLPDNEILNVLDRPSGRVIGELDASDGEIRARYYYTADEYNVWAGVCSSTGTCGWVSSDYLFSLKPGETDRGIYSVTPDRVQVYDGPARSANAVGLMYRGNQMMMIEEVDTGDGRWAHVCRMEGCGWVALEFITLEF